MLKNLKTMNVVCQVNVFIRVCLLIGRSELYYTEYLVKRYSQ